MGSRAWCLVRRHQYASGGTPTSASFEVLFLAVKPRLLIPPTVYPQTDVYYMEQHRQYRRIMYTCIGVDALTR